MTSERTSRRDLIKKAIAVGSGVYVAPMIVGSWRVSAQVSGSPTCLNTIGGWTCAPTGTNCQDVWDIQFSAGSVVTIQVTQVSADSFVRLAMYGPGVALGGLNLITGDTRELFCPVSGCSNGTAGLTVSNFSITATGTHRIAVTRDWGNSCGGSGTYQLIVTSNQGCSSSGQTVNDVASLASGGVCL